MKKIFFFFLSFFFLINCSKQNSSGYISNSDTPLVDTLSQDTVVYDTLKNKDITVASPDLHYCNFTPYRLGSEYTVIENNLENKYSVKNVYKNSGFDFFEVWKNNSPSNVEYICSNEDRNVILAGRGLNPSKTICSSGNGIVYGTNFPLKFTDPVGDQWEVIIAGSSIESLPPYKFQKIVYTMIDKNLAIEFNGKTYPNGVKLKAEYYCGEVVQGVSPSLIYSAEYNYTGPYTLADTEEIVWVCGLGLYSKTRNNSIIYQLVKFKY